MKFNLDTQAKAIPQSLFHKLTNNLLKGAETKLSTYGNNLVKPLGKIGKIKLTCETKTAGIKQDLEFCVVDFKATPMLGLQACRSLKLLEKIDTVESESQNVTMKSLLKVYDSNFQGLSKFEGNYNIELDPSAKPVVNPPRVVSQTLMPKLKKALKKFEVIAAVEEATDWVDNLGHCRKEQWKVKTLFRSTGTE